MENSLKRIYDEVLFAMVKQKLITSDDREELNFRLKDKIYSKDTKQNIYK